jgi:hypothetical protein
MVIEKEEKMGDCECDPENVGRCFCYDEVEEHTKEEMICVCCGQVKGIQQYDDKLWDIYNRIDDGRSSYEPLVFYSDWLQENVLDEEDFEAVNLAMEKDMKNRGLCIKCGRPNLSGVDPDSIMSEEDAKEMQEMWAEQKAERRMGA